VLPSKLGKGTYIKDYEVVVRIDELIEKKQGEEEEKKELV